METDQKPRECVSWNIRRGQQDSRFQQYEFAQTIEVHLPSIVDDDVGGCSYSNISA
jgi:hypothetical protein